MKYKYFVSYFFKSTSSWGIGAGNGELIRNKKITTYEDIKGIIEYLEETENIKNVVIINYILLAEREL